jgi:hypothetical protein
VRRARLALSLAALLAIPAGAQAALIQTKPIVKNAVATVEGAQFRADDRGIITIPDALLRLSKGVPTNVRMLDKTPMRRNGYAQFDRWFGTRGGRRPFTAAFNVYYPFVLFYLGPDGRRVPKEVVARVAVKSDIGQSIVMVRIDDNNDAVNASNTYWAQTVVSRQGGPVVKNIEYRVRQVLVAGSNVITQSKEKFIPALARSRFLKLIYFPVKVKAYDAIFHFPIGDGIVITYPNGKDEMRAFTSNGQIELGALPRGRYKIRVAAPGYSFTRPLALTRPQDVQLQVISYLDLAAVLFLVSGLAITLVVYPRRHRFGFRAKRARKT